MSGSRFIKRRLAVASLFAVLGGVLPAAAQECGPTKPYVFILFDTSGSMNYSPPCTQAQLNSWDCSLLCPTGDCFVPLQGDDPASKLFQMKEALYTVLENLYDVQLGFATYNQDALRVKSKHWLYVATNNGPIIPGVYPYPPAPYPAVGDREVFGALWGCSTGSGDNQIGCSTASPADLPDAWEVARVRRLPKGGASFNQAQSVFVRKGSFIYRVTYLPTGTPAPGAPTLSVNVKTERCQNSSCTSVLLIGQQTVTWRRMEEFLSWDNGTTASLNRTNPALSYFPGTTNDAAATNTCGGWEPNSDSASDPFNGYNLRWPTTADLRGPAFDQGDMIPLDWLSDHRQDILSRLAPNLGSGALTPDFRISAYFQDLPQPGETFLRLKDEAARPLIALGSAPLGGSIQSFRQWYQDWEPVAATNDPEWACRRKALIVITDDAIDCSAVNACADVEALYAQHNVKSYAIDFGAPYSENGPLACIAANGGTHSPVYPQNKSELIQALSFIFEEIVTP